MLCVLEMGEIQRDTLISGKYRVLDRLGAGGMGAVYSATHTAVGRKVALKFLRADLSTTPGTVERFRREARAAGTIGHENILEVFDVGETDDGSPFIVMELLEGESLARLLAREKKLPIGRAMHITAQVLWALDAAHHLGIVHRDLKPENVFLTTRAGQLDFVKVLDFGISAVLTESSGDTRLTQTGDVLGTPPYMAPEQARGETVIDHRCDLWATAVVLFEMLTGCLPFPGDNGLQVIGRILTEPAPRPSSVFPELPSEIDSLLLRALDKDKRVRFQSAGAFFDAMAPMLPESSRMRQFNLTPGATPMNWAVVASSTADTAMAASVPPSPRRLRRALLPSAIGLTVLLIALAVVATQPRSRPIRPTTRLSEAPVADNVTIDVSATPPNASIVLDSAVAPSNPARLRLARSDRSLRLQVSAPGYQAVERWIVSDRDRSIEIALLAVEPARSSPPHPPTGVRPDRRRPSAKQDDIFTDLGGSR